MPGKGLIDKIKAQSETVASISEERAAQKRAEAEAAADIAQKLKDKKEAQEKRLNEVKGLALSTISDIAHEFQAVKLDPSKEPLVTTIKDGHWEITSFYRLTYTHADKRVGSPLRVGVSFGWCAVGPEVDPEQRVLWIGGALLVKPDGQDEWKPLTPRGSLPKEISERIGFSKVSADAIEDAVERIVAHYQESST